VLLSHLTFPDRARLGLAKRTFPVKPPKFLLVDILEIGLVQPLINQVHVPSIARPKIIPDLALRYPAKEDFCVFPPYQVIFSCENPVCSCKFSVSIPKDLFGEKVLIKCPSCGETFLFIASNETFIEDCTKQLWGEDTLSNIDNFPVGLVSPRIVGKVYRAEKTKETEHTLFELEEGENLCVHGLKKSWCSTCIAKKKEEKSLKGSDLFDLIFPILMPPPGRNLDSPLFFAGEKTLYPFQRDGVKFLAEHNVALLADEMGLGKSIQAIIAIRILIRTGKIRESLIICPKSVLGDWEKKLWDWAPELSVLTVRGSPEKRLMWWKAIAHIHLATYETVRQDFGENLVSNGEDIGKTSFDLVVLDEIQKIKNPGADVTKTVRSIKSDMRWGLSGTPLENRIEDIISIFRYLKPGLLRDIDGINPSRIKGRMAEYFLRRRKKDALPELPEKFHEEKYRKAEEEGIVDLNEQGDSITVQHVLALITKLKQICNIDPITRESSKLEYIEEKIEEICEEDEKVLVFSQYPEKTLPYLQTALEKFSPEIYHGGLSDRERDEIVERFQNEETPKLLLMSVKAGGLGITLTRACHVYHFDLWWNPAVAAQAEDRAHRIGQMKTVFVTSLFTNDTIEERIEELLRKKRALFTEVIDDLSDTKLSNILSEEDLFSLFNLKRPSLKYGLKEKVDDHRGMSLDQKSPQEFEIIVSQLYNKMGYNIKLTQQSKDGGIDIYAKRVSESGSEYLAIQCKHYPNSVVNVEQVRALYGVVQSEPQLTKGVLVTSGRFSRECKEFARGKRIELFDRDYLLGLLGKYELNILMNGT
jgi:superfamily II DNA or RNA helicase/HJR/Mrr/RecB family endonuclease